MNKTVIQTGIGTLLALPCVSQVNTPLAPTTTEDIRHLVGAAVISIVGQLALKLGNKLIALIGQRHRRRALRRRFNVFQHNQTQRVMRRRIKKTEAAQTTSV